MNFLFLIFCKLILITSYGAIEAFCLSDFVSQNYFRFSFFFLFRRLTMQKKKPFDLASTRAAPFHRCRSLTRFTLRNIVNRIRRRSDENDDGGVIDKS